MPKSRPKMSEVYDMVRKIMDSVRTGLPQPPLLHYRGSASKPSTKRAKKGSLRRRRGSASEPSTKRAKKGSLRRRLRGFGFGCQNICGGAGKPEIVKDL